LRRSNLLQAAFSLLFPPDFSSQSSLHQGQPMIIDCHGHYTTAPDELGKYRDAQKAALKQDPNFIGEKGSVNISDDQIRESLENSQLKLQRERGTDVT